jgi:GTPase SAR1 family protein
VQVLKDLLGFDVDTSQVNFSRPSVILGDRPTEEISNIAPLMKFVDRQVSTEVLFRCLDDYLQWKENPTGEAEKNIKFITVVGTSGKGKTTFARRFMDLSYSGNYADIVNDCKEMNRRYRVRCTKFDIARDAETQLSLIILFEAFKYSSGAGNLQDYLNEFNRKFYYHTIAFADVLQLITQKFTSRSDVQQRLLIINLDETNALLNNDKQKGFFQELLRLLRDASESFTLLTILSGTHSVDLFEQVKISQSKFVDIELSLIGLEASMEVILGMTSKPGLYVVSPHLKYLLTLCGGVGRYLEIAIIQMSIIGSAKMGGAVMKGFKLNAYEYFLEKLQTPQYIETLLEKLTTCVLSHYPKVFSRFSQSIELLSCYTLFQWSVQRETIINLLSVGSLEKEGLVFLQPVATSSDRFICIIPFITLYWAIKESNQNVQIPFLKDIKSYYSPEESENNSLHIVMAKMWGLVKKNDISPDTQGLCTVKLSELFPLRKSQPDFEIKFRPVFEIKTSSQRINLHNYDTYEKLAADSDCIAYLNGKGASFSDSIIFSTPRIGLQEKQRVESKKRKLNGKTPVKSKNSSFQVERAKFPQNDIFVLVTDEETGDIKLGHRDVFLDCKNFAEFSGPLIALRKLFCINELNGSVKRLKLK